MTTLRSVPTARDRLVARLRAPGRRSGPFALASRETLAAARVLDPALAGDAVAEVLADYVPGAETAPAERAAHVACELRLPGAIPALAACVERLPEGDRVASVSCASLGLIGRPAVDALAERLARAPTPDARFAVGLVLTLLPPDSRIRAAFEALLPRDPGTATRLLALLGETPAPRRRALPC